VKRRTANNGLGRGGPYSPEYGARLEALGVELNRGYIKVDERMRTASETIYAIGDCEWPTPAGACGLREGIAAVEFWWQAEKCRSITAGIPPAFIVSRIAVNLNATGNSRVSRPHAPAGVGHSHHQ